MGTAPMTGLDMACHSDDEDLQPSGMVARGTTEADRDQVTLAASPYSSTSDDNSAVIPETPVPGTPTPVALHRAGAAPAVDEAERTGPVLSHQVRPPSLRLTNLLEVASLISVTDVDSVVQHLTRRYVVPHSPAVFADIIIAIIATRLHVVSRLMDQLTHFGLTGCQTPKSLW